MAALLAAAQLAAVPFWQPSRAPERWPEVAALLRARMQPGDAIFIVPMEAQLMLAHHGWNAAGHELYGAQDTAWYLDFPGRAVPPEQAVPEMAPDRTVWIVTRRATPRHEAAVARLSATRKEHRLMRGGTRDDSGIDVSVLVPR